MAKAKAVKAPTRDAQRRVALNKLRIEIGRQDSAISEQLKDLNALKDVLQNKSDRSTAENKQLINLMIKIGDLQNTRTNLRVAYLNGIAKIVDLSGLIGTLRGISDQMETEAQRIEDSAAAIRTAGKIVNLGTRAIGAIGE